MSPTSLAAALALVVGVVGCGGSARSTVAGAVHTAPPRVARQPTSGPDPTPEAAGPAVEAPYEQLGVTFTSAEVGFRVSVDNITYRQHTTVIDETTDGGATWERAWTGPYVFLSWIGQAGPDLVAFGDQESPVPNAPSAADRSVVVTGTDGGTHWTVAPSTGPTTDEEFVAAFATSTTGIEVPDPDYFQYPVGRVASMQRTTDGGRTWAAVSLPGGRPSGGAAFISPTIGFVTGYPVTAPPDCRGELWRTVDAGSTWVPLPATCRPFTLAGITFPTPAVGYAVGGSGDDHAAAGAVIATADGGATWSTRYVGAPRPLGHTFTVAAFVSPVDGYVLAASCQGSGGEGSCDGPLLETTDGGRTWVPTRLSGSRLSAPRNGGPHVVPGLA